MEGMDIIEQFHKGDEKGLKAAFHLYNRPLMYFAMQYVKKQEVAEEVVSDVFIKLWENRNRFENLNKLRAFLYISVKNASLNHVRTAEYKLHKLPIDAYEELIFEDADILRKIITSELVKKIHDEMQKLPEKQQQVFLLTFIKDFSPEEIGDKLGISLSAVYANKSRAIATLRTSLKTNKSFYLYLLFCFLF